MLLGQATPEATERYLARHAAWRKAGFYREVQGLHVSSLGIGSYLGPIGREVDERYTQSMMAAVRSGINFIDTSLNYRHQRSERAIGQAIVRLTAAREVDRDEFAVCTKAGYLVPDAVPANLLAEDVAGGVHCMAPAFLRDQVERSRENLGIETLDVLYLHNPETQLQSVSEDVFYSRVRAAFEAAETLAAENRIQFYGAATWQGFRAARGKAGLLSLPRMVQMARDVAGDRHHFRFIQLPVNLAMREALTVTNQTLGGADVSVLAAARELGITVVASASLLQSKLAREQTDAERAIQFTRSTPGVVVALVGMSSPEHVGENMRIAGVPPLPEQQYYEMFQPAS